MLPNKEQDMNILKYNYEEIQDNPNIKELGSSRFSVLTQALDHSTK